MAALLAGLAAFTGCEVEAPPPPDDALLSPGEAKDAAGGPVSVGNINALAARLNAAQGKVAVVNLWATWCPPCVAEMPEFVDFHRQYVPEKAVFVSVSLDDPASADDAVADFHRKKGLPFDVLVLDERQPDALTDILQTEISGALPTTLVYGPDGKLAQAWEAAITMADLEGAVNPLL